MYAALISFVFFLENKQFFFFKSRYRDWSIYKFQVSGARVNVSNVLYYYYALLFIYLFHLYAQRHSKRQRYIGQILPNHPSASLQHREARPLSRRAAKR